MAYSSLLEEKFKMLRELSVRCQFGRRESSSLDLVPPADRDVPYNMSCFRLFTTPWTNNLKYIGVQSKQAT